MPEPTPTTDTMGKKPNKTTIILMLAGGAVIVYFFIRQKRKSEETSIPYSSQAFIPVTGENVAGAGATGSIGNSGGASGEFATLLEQSQRENSEFVQNLLKSEQEERREQEMLRKEEFRSQIELLKGLTGGGAPVGTGPPSGGTPGGTPTPTGPGGSPPPVTPKTPSKCSGAYPYEGPHGCYTKIKCGNGCEGHKYQSGVTECQHGEARRGTCKW